VSDEVTTSQPDASSETEVETDVETPDAAETDDRGMDAAMDPAMDPARDPATGGAGGERPSKLERLENEGDIAADYLEELLDIADLDGDLDMDVEGDRAAVSIVGAELSQLVGRNGEVLDALQELTRLAVYRETGERSRLMLDISGYRANRREELVALAETSIAQVKESGQPASLEPMTSFERTVVLDAVAAAGLTSESEGAEPKRYVVILPE
jgi:spoIIIJ-associated protein